MKKENKNEYQNFENQFNNVDTNGVLKILSNKLDINNNSKMINYKSKYDTVLEEMQRQSQD